jgi:hypothetical protein
VPNNIEAQTALIELHYFPCLAWFAQLLRFESIRLETQENFVKQSYRNRCYIQTANNVTALSVPLRGGSKQALRDIEIDYSQRWTEIHWRTIQSGYGNAPYFEFFESDIRQLLEAKPSRLLDLNELILTKCLKLLNHKVKIEFTEVFEKEPNNSYLDLRNSILPNKPLPDFLEFDPMSYYQVFGANFVNNLSILDLLFCEGPQAKSVLWASINKKH